MDETLDYAERRTQARIAEIDDGEREAGDVLEAARTTSSCDCARRSVARRSRSTSPAAPTSTTAI